MTCPKVELSIESSKPEVSRLQTMSWGAKRRAAWFSDDEDLLLELYNKGDFFFHRKMASNLNLSPRLVKLLSESEDACTREYLAENSCIDRDTLVKLSKDKVHQVQCATIRNINVNDEILNTIINSADELTRSAGIRLFAYSTNIREKIADRSLMGDELLKKILRGESSIRMMGTLLCREPYRNSLEAQRKIYDYIIAGDNVENNLQYLARCYTLLPEMQRLIFSHNIQKVNRAFISNSNVEFDLIKALYRSEDEIEWKKIIYRVMCRHPKSKFSNFT